MNKSIDDSMSLPTTRSHNRRRFSIRRFFCRRPSTRFALSFVGTGIADRNKTDDNDGSLQSMAAVSLNTVAANSNVASKSDNSSTNYYASEGDHEGSVIIANDPTDRVTAPPIVNGESFSARLLRRFRRNKKVKRRMIRNEVGDYIDADRIGETILDEVILNEDFLDQLDSAIEAAISRINQESEVKFTKSELISDMKIKFEPKGILDPKEKSEVINNCENKFKEFTTRSRGNYIVNDKGLELSQNGHECTLCYIHQPSYEFPRVSSCSHRFCVTCLKQYITIELTESRVLVTCPACNEMYHPSTIANILDNKELIDKYENFMLRRVLVIDPDTRWCPAPDCGYAVIASGCAVCPKLECEKPGCGTSFCYHCKQLWHPNQTCDSARKDKHDITDSYSQNSQGELKACPRCSQFIMKLNDGSCNHMVCAICGLEFCWLCMKEINDLHYLSPSGCTFWGRKPWTRKKKTLAQLGTLVGAPVVIALLSTIAVPAIIIYSPIWVGKKILQQRFKSKSKRKLVTAVGVSSTIILSPLLAAITVGVGVPLLFGYVYIVVPLSMCKDCRPEQANYNSDNSYELATVEEKPIVEQQDKAMSIADSMGAIKNKTQDNKFVLFR